MPSIVSDLRAHGSNLKLCLGFKNCSALWLSWDGTGAPLAGHGKTELHAKRNDRIFSMFVCSFVYSFDKCLCFSCAACWGYSRTGQGQRQLSRCCQWSRGWGAPENKQTNKLKPSLSEEQPPPRHPMSVPITAHLTCPVDSGSDFLSRSWAPQEQYP